MTRPDILGTLESALYVDDLDAARRFWGGIMGLAEIIHIPGRHVFFRTGDKPFSQVLLIFNAERTAKPPKAGARFPVPPHGAHGPGHFCLAAASEQLDAWRDYLQAEGVEIEADFTWPSGARSLYFRDPAGNSIELADPSIWTPKDEGPADEKRDG